MALPRRTERAAMVNESSGRADTRSSMPTDSRGRAEARPSGASEATTVYFVAGERSGDDHGGALLKALRARVPGMRFVGRGGPKCALSPAESFAIGSIDTAVVGLWEVIRRYPFFSKAISGYYFGDRGGEAKRSRVDRLPGI